MRTLRLILANETATDTVTALLHTAVAFAAGVSVVVVARALLAAISV